MTTLSYCDFLQNIPLLRPERIHTSWCQQDGCCVQYENVSAAVLLRHCRRLRLKCDGTRAETRFLLSAKRTSPFKSAGASVQSTTGSRGVRISGSNAGYTMFRGSVKSTDYPLHSQGSPSLPLPCVTVCHHISTGLCKEYFNRCVKSIYLSVFFNSCRRLPETKRHSSLFLHWSGSKFVVVMAACTPSIHVFFSPAVSNP